MRLHILDSSAATETITHLTALGYQVTSSLPNPPALRALGENPPDAVVIDLSRRPSAGRDAGVALRLRKTTRAIPLLFVGGEADKVAQVRQLLPDAVFTDWERFPADLEAAVRNPPVGASAPASVFAAYAETPLVRKLGIKPGARVFLIGAPDGFVTALGELPEGVQFQEAANPAPDLTVWFTRTLAELNASLPDVIAGLGKSHLWIAWPKQGSALASDLSQAAVRQAGLNAGLVDYKIASFDDTWTGLKFSKRKSTTDNTTTD